MFKFTIRIANQTIEVNTLYPHSYSYCKAFLFDGDPSFRVQITQADIDHEKRINKSEPNMGKLGDPYVEILALHRIISDKLIDYNTFLFHGAAISVNGIGLVFCGTSGIGKSTHILKWLHKVPDAVEINGDKPYIVAGDKPLVCGSPWGGKEKLFTNNQIPLKSIILLERSENNSIRSIPLSFAFPRLCQLIPRPNDVDKTKKTLNLLRSIYPTVSFWLFKCNNFKADCFDVAYDALVRNQS